MLTKNIQSLKQILALQKLELPPEEIEQLYPRAYALPQFFTHNLVSKQRVVKYFQGPYALIGAFYYQLMKLSIEIDDEDINYRDIVVNKFVQFDLFGQGELEDETFTDFQYRKFMKDFIELAENEEFPNFEKSIQKYPIIDEILIKLFKIIIPIPLMMGLQQSNGDNKQIAMQILQLLCDQFQITKTEFGDCIKFEQSDTFLYIQNPQEIYLAFNEALMVPAKQYSSFKSTFECGQGNSFITKYHSQKSGSHTTNNSETIKPSCQQKGEQVWVQAGVEPLIKMPVSESCFAKRIQSRPYFNVQTCRMDKQAEQSISFKPLSSFLNQGRAQEEPNKPLDLYKQFTNSLILKQMPSIYSEGIRQIKNKYSHNRTRSSIRGYF